MATAAERSRSARIAANTSWARTADRSERTRRGYESSPMSYAYWLRKVTEEGVVQPKDRPKAAENAWRAHQQKMSDLAAKARKAKAEAARNPSQER